MPECPRGWKREVTVEAYRRQRRPRRYAWRPPCRSTSPTGIAAPTDLTPRSGTRWLARAFSGEHAVGEGRALFDFITKAVEQSGYLGIALLMFAENVFPPIPSEVIMPLAGYTAGRGGLNIIGVIATGSAGSLAGALLWYYIGRWLGRERLRRFTSRHGRLLTVEPGELDKAFGWFDEHGGKAVLVGRCIPAVRTFISVPAGICGMPMTRFLIWSGLGTIVWTGGLAVGGYLLGAQHDRISTWMSPVSYGVIGLLVLIYLYRVVTFDPEPEKGSR